MDVGEGSGHRLGMIADAAELGQLPLFEGVSTAVLLRLAPALRWRTFRTHDEILGPGGDLAYLVVEGMARAYGMAGSHDVTWFFLTQSEIAGQDSFVRFAHFLGRLSKLVGPVLGYSQAELGSWCGLSRTQANRFIHRLARRRLVRHERNGREIRVPDPDLLLAL